MKQPFRAIIPLLFSVALLLSLTTTASAAFSDFTDVKGHWAEGTLHQAYDDGILKGYDAKTMAPNRSVTMVQAVTILCRVLHVTGRGDISQFEIPQDAWYAQDVAKGVYAGLLEEQDAQVLNDPIPRGQAFILFGQAFQVVGAQPDLSVLDQFPDTAFLTGVPVSDTHLDVYKRQVIDASGTIWFGNSKGLIYLTRDLPGHQEPECRECRKR